MRVGEGGREGERREWGESMREGSCTVREDIKCYAII